MQKIWRENAKASNLPYRDGFQRTGMERQTPTHAEFGEALEFFATLLRLRVFHPMERELPPARQRLGARFAASSAASS